MKVAVIGCGPSGILAALGALQEGADVTIVSPVIKASTIHGAQYIHHPIEGVTDQFDPFEIRYRYVGSEDEYRRKIYGGQVPVMGTSWGRFRPLEVAWSMEDVYREAWMILSGHAQWKKDSVTGLSLMHIYGQKYDYVLNTAPLRALVPDGRFYTETVKIAPVDHFQIPKNQIWYMGNEEAPYRGSNIGEVVSTEWPSAAKVPRRYRKHLSVIHKPLDCAVDLPGIHRLGRYGKWKKGQLAHHAYEEAREIISKRLSWTASLRA